MRQACVVTNLHPQHCGNRFRVRILATTERTEVNAGRGQAAVAQHCLDVTDLGPGFLHGPGCRMPERMHLRRSQPLLTYLADAPGAQTVPTAPVAGGHVVGFSR